MPRSKTNFVCQECGFQSSKFLGRCTECNTWSSLVEELIVDDDQFKGRLSSAQATNNSKPKPLPEINADGHLRLSTGMPSFDLVLGGGVVPGSVILLAGDPGIGKSTLLLQICGQLAKSGQVLYITGEESAAQVKNRASRLKIDSPQILLDSDQNTLLIEKKISESEVQVAIVDSIQSLYHPELSSAIGSVSQVKESTAILTSTAKTKEIAMILVGHVTKDGSIAGPRVLEHMVDVVLQFEGDKTRQLRILRASKNRYGSTSEVGVFTMSANGLVEIDNPSALFLGDRLDKLAYEKSPSGTAVIATGEGSKALLLEVQALVGPTPYPSPRRVVNGLDNNRLLQILAVLERKVGLSLSRFDVYVNIVGGFDFSDPSGDLGVAIAISTSYFDRSIDPRLILIGEIGLTAEVRPVAFIEKRLKEAARMGFNKAIVPKGNLPLEINVPGIDIQGVEYLKEALQIVMPGEKMTAGKKFGEDSKFVEDGKFAEGSKIAEGNEGSSGESHLSKIKERNIVTT